MVTVRVVDAGDEKEEGHFAVESQGLGQHGAGCSDGIGAWARDVHMADRLAGGCDWGRAVADVRLAAG